MPELSPRNRIVLISALSAVAVAAIVAAVLLSGEPDAEPSAQPTPQETVTSASAEPTLSASPSAAPTGFAPGEVVVQPAGDSLPLFAEPGADAPDDELAKWTYLGATTTLLGFDQTTVDGAEWIQVELAGAPNHRTAWVRAEDATVTSTDVRIDVYLDEREVDLSVAGEVQITSAAVIGADESPTPLGVFWVTDPLDFSLNTTGVYGAYALGLNGWSEVLEEFNGGAPQIALHGTNEPELVGQAVSNGCVRVPNEIVTQIAELAPVGTPVVVHQSR